MPLASYASLHWYGPGLGAAVDTCTPTADAVIKGSGRMAATHTTAPTALARINDGRQLRAVHTTAPTAYARPSGRGRIAAVGKVNELSQDDVAGALLTARVEGDYTFRDVMRLMAATLAGKVSGAETATVTFRAITDAKDRVVSVTDVDGNRTAVTLDPT